MHIGVYNEAGELIKSFPILETIAGDHEFQSASDADHHHPARGGVRGSERSGRSSRGTGQNQNGDPVLNGSYYVKVDSTDPLGVTNTITQVVTVNRHLAKVQVNIFNEAGEIIRHLTSYVDDAGTFQINNVTPLQLGAAAHVGCDAGAGQIRTL